VKFKPDVIEWCSCPDNSLRGGQMRCKYLHAIEFVIRLGTLRDIEKLPTEAKVRKAGITKATAIVVQQQSRIFLTNMMTILFDFLQR
jgi:predicted nucleic acid-binding Zn finger protein